MTDRMTSIQLRTMQHAGFADWGRLTVPQMVAEIRAMAKWELEWARAVLAASDEDFHVETYLGVHVRQNREVLQEGLPKLRAKPVPDVVG